ncbi:hypothetical protein GEMRC1_010082 [Eukaryota sp. GEM-RC1]
MPPSSLKLNKLSKTLFGVGTSVVDQSKLRTLLDSISSVDEDDIPICDLELLNSINSYAASACPPHLLERLRFSSLLTLGVVIDTYIDSFLQGLDEEAPFSESAENNELLSSDSEALLDSDEN